MASLTSLPDFPTYFLPWSVVTTLLIFHRLFSNSSQSLCTQTQAMSFRFRYCLFSTPCMVISLAQSLITEAQFYPSSTNGAFSSWNLSKMLLAGVTYQEQCFWQFNPLLNNFQLTVASNFKYEKLIFSSSTLWGMLNLVLRCVHHLQWASGAILCYLSILDTWHVCPVKHLCHHLIIPFQMSV